ncbi:PucR family transcriptional regulator [Angustibacter luteus]|uniref:PucR family transcriptional regulator n=1 Tax=Angustibacter luteus TaxID=658456 RepID=A0ABW1JHF1_9ACTN
MSENDASQQPSHTARGAAELELGQDTLDLLRSRLAAVAEDTVRAITEEVPGYAGAFTGPMGATIQAAVQLALGGFLNLAGQPRAGDPGTPMAPALEGAYALGRGEARGGRSMDALLAAYRVGARVAWRDLSATAVDAGLPAGTVSKFAGLVFAYIDELSAASVAGHTDELATTGRVRQRYLQRLGHSLLRGDPVDRLAAAAERADWAPPRTLTAVVLPAGRVRTLLTALDPRTLRPDEDLPDLQADEDESELGVLLVPDADGPRRRALLRTLQGHDATAGPARPWADVRESYLRVLRARRLGLIDQPGQGEAAVDTEQHLAALVVSSDPAALADLRRRALAPLDGVRPSTAERLAETLREWLLHQGRRDDVAAVLHVHPQTVRYRMGQIRELYGDRLQDPDVVLDLTVALARG